jgi:hypothetical protein
MRDRARVIVTAGFGYRVRGPSPYKADTDHIIITVANAGRRPRTIAQVGFTLRKNGKDQHIVATDSMLKGAQELTEGKSAMYLVEQRDTRPEDVVKVWAYDQLGKEHTGRVKG